MEHHPSSLRNRGPILEVLKELFPNLEGNALELASGSGAHMEVIAPAFPKTTWQPSEYSAEQVPALWQCLQKLPNVKEPLVIDASTSLDNWKIAPSSLQLVYTSNVTHISPFPATLGLIEGASKALVPGGSLVVYGPFKVNNEFTTPSNAEFDENLRGRNPLWGYRDVSQLHEKATACGFSCDPPRPMPANNFLLRFTKQA
ncbi:UPF0585 protein [Diplonema papillatum]|nr:UPF0585 protein [Diplonema papillatum]